MITSDIELYFIIKPFVSIFCKSLAAYFSHCDLLSLLIYMSSLYISMVTLCHIYYSCFMNCFLFLHFLYDIFLCCQIYPVLLCHSSLLLKSLILFNGLVIIKTHFTYLLHSLFAYTISSFHSRKNQTRFLCTCVTLHNFTSFT